MKANIVINKYDGGTNAVISTARGSISISQSDDGDLWGVQTDQEVAHGSRGTLHCSEAGVVERVKQYLEMR